MKSEGIAIASLTASLAIFTVSPALAASFEFSLQGLSGGGFLSFDNPIPTGTFELSQLKNAQLSYSFNGQPTYGEYPGPPLANFNPSNATVTFNNGQLTGVNSETELSGFNQTITAAESAATIKGDYSLFLQGDRYSQYFTGTETVGGYNSQTGQFYNYTETYNNQLFASGSILFKNLEPVPEPSTIIGTITALGLITSFKRKVKKS